MLPMLTWVTLKSDHIAIGRLGGYLISAQMVTCSVAVPQCSVGQLAMDALNAVAKKVCKHNSLATKFPSVAAQWDCAANDGTPDSVVAQSSQLAGWLCNACGCRWLAKIRTRISRIKAR